MRGIWRRVRAALGLGVVWAGGGAFVGGLVELVSNLFSGLPLGFVDMWIPFLAIPGFLGGVIFSGVLGVAARRRSFEELSMPGMTAVGAVGGILLGAIMVATGAPAAVLVPTTLLSAVGASLTLTLARMAGSPGALPSGDAVEDAGLTEAEERDLLG